LLKANWFNKEQATDYIRAMHALEKSEAATIVSEEVFDHKQGYTRRFKGSIGCN